MPGHRPLGVRARGRRRRPPRRRLRRAALAGARPVPHAEGPAGRPLARPFVAVVGAALRPPGGGPQRTRPRIRRLLGRPAGPRPRAFLAWSLRSAPRPPPRSRRSRRGPGASRRPPASAPTTARPAPVCRERGPEHQPGDEDAQQPPSTARGERGQAGAGDVGLPRVSRFTVTCHRAKAALLRTEGRPHPAGPRPAQAPQEEPPEGHLLHQGHQDGGEEQQAQQEGLRGGLPHPRPPARWAPRSGPGSRNHSRGHGQGQPPQEAPAQVGPPAPGVQPQLRQGAPLAPAVPKR